MVDEFRAYKATSVLVGRARRNLRHPTSRERPGIPNTADHSKRQGRKCRHVEWSVRPDNRQGHPSSPRSCCCRVPGATPWDKVALSVFPTSKMRDDGLFTRGPLRNRTPRTRSRHSTEHPLYPFPHSWHYVLLNVPDSLFSLTHAKKMLSYGTHKTGKGIQTPLEVARILSWLSYRMMSVPLHLSRFRECGRIVLVKEVLRLRMSSVRISLSRTSNSCVNYGIGNVIHPTSVP